MPKINVSVQAVFLNNMSTKRDFYKYEFLLSHSQRSSFHSSFFRFYFCWLIIEVLLKNEDVLFSLKNGWPFLWKQVPLFFWWISRPKENRVNSPLHRFSLFFSLSLSFVLRVSLVSRLPARHSSWRSSDRGALGRTRCLHEKASERSVSRSCWVWMKKCKCQLNILLIRLCRVPASGFFCSRSIGDCVRTDSSRRARVFVSLNNARREKRRVLLLEET